MNKQQIDGMEARASGLPRASCGYSGDERYQWLVGYDTMDCRISELLKNANEMLSTLQSLRGRQNFRLVAR